jgi:hypothetical protein
VLVKYIRYSSYIIGKVPNVGNSYFSPILANFLANFSKFLNFSNNLKKFQN